MANMPEVLDTLFVVGLSLPIVYMAWATNYLQLLASLVRWIRGPDLATFIVISGFLKLGFFTCRRLLKGRLISDLISYGLPLLPWAPALLLAPIGAVLGNTELALAAFDFFFQAIFIDLIFLPILMLMFLLEAVVRKEGTVATPAILTMVVYTSLLLLAISHKGAATLAAMGQKLLMNSAAFMIGSVVAVLGPSRFDEMRVSFLKEWFAIPQPPIWIQAAFVLAAALYYFYRLDFLNSAEEVTPVSATSASSSSISRLRFIGQRSAGLMLLAACALALAVIQLSNLLLPTNLTGRIFVPLILVVAFAAMIPRVERWAERKA